MTAKLWKIWWAALLIKLLLAALVPFAHDEAYYWFWSTDPKLSYYDHPGMIAWLLYIGQVFASLGQAERWPVVVLGHLSVWFWLDTFRVYLSDRRQMLFLLMFLLFPLTGPGSVIATPDVPLLFFWSAAFWFWQRTLQQTTPLNYVGLGVALGTGFCSKYHIVLFVPIIFIQLLLTRSWSRVSWHWVPLTLGFGLLFSLPVLIWNYQHNFVSFSYQLQHGLKKDVWTPAVPGLYVLGQLLLLCPLLIWAICRSPFPKALSFLKPWVWFPLAFFGVSSLRAPVEANWTMVTFPAWLICAAAVDETRIKYIKQTLWIWALGLMFVVSEIFFRWLPLDPKHWKMKEFFEFRELPAAVEKYQPLYASSYQMASQLTYLMHKPVYKLFGTTRRDYYDELPDSLPKATTYYVIVNHQWSWETPLQFQGHEKIDRYQVHPDFDVLLINVVPQKQHD